MKKRRHSSSPYCFSVLVCLAVWTIDVGRNGLSAYHIVKERMAWAQQLGQGKSLLQDPGELDSIQADLSVLDSNLRALQRDLHPLYPVLLRLDGLPRVGAELAAAPHLLDTGVELLAAARIGFPAGRAVLAAAGTDGSNASTGLSPSALSALADMGPALQAMQPYVQQAQAAWAAIKDKELMAPLGTYMKRLDDYMPLLDVALVGAQAAPALLGADGPRTYLLLAQNSDELRATRRLHLQRGHARCDGRQAQQPQPAR